jgi:hypothetical protein
METTACLAARWEKLVEQRRQCGNNGLFRQIQVYRLCFGWYLPSQRQFTWAFGCSERAGVAFIMPLSFANAWRERGESG